MKVYFKKNIQKELEKHHLTVPFKKACGFIEERNYKAVDLKLRKPKHLGVYQFRITKKYRAMAFKEKNILVVYKISDHQGK